VYMREQQRRYAGKASQPSGLLLCSGHAVLRASTLQPAGHSGARLSWSLHKSNAAHMDTYQQTTRMQERPEQCGRAEIS